VERDVSSATEPTTAVAPRPDRTPLSQRNPVALAEHFWKSGYFTDVKSMSQAVVKIVAGEELGIPPMAAMQGVHIIKGKPSMSANLHAVQVKRSEHYNFRPVETTEELAKIEWFEDGVSIGFSEYTIAQAKKAGLVKTDSGWARNPEDMLFARALTRGIRRWCPEIMIGTPAYVPEELGAEVDEQGEPVYVESVVEPTQDTAPPTGLPAEKIDALVKGYELAGPELGGVTPLDGLNFLLGSIGVDAFEPGEDLAVKFASLSEEQADEILGEFNVLLDAEGVTETEVVEEDGEPVRDADEEVAANAG
jgi:hypothetical protein